MNVPEPGSAVDTDAAGGRADNPALCKSPGHLCFFSSLSIHCILFIGTGSKMFDSFSDPLVYGETCKNFNFNLLLNISNQQSQNLSNHQIPSLLP